MRVSEQRVHGGAWALVRAAPTERRCHRSGDQRRHNQQQASGRRQQQQQASHRRCQHSDRAVATAQLRQPAATGALHPSGLTWRSPPGWAASRAGGPPARWPPPESGGRAGGRATGVRRTGVCSSGARAARLAPTAGAVLAVWARGSPGHMSSFVSLSKPAPAHRHGVGDVQVVDLQGGAISCGTGQYRAAQRGHVGPGTDARRRRAGNGGGGGSTAAS